MISTFTSIMEDWYNIANLKRYILVNIKFYATS